MIRKIWKKSKLKCEITWKIKVVQSYYFWFCLFIHHVQQVLTQNFVPWSSLPRGFLRAWRRLSCFVLHIDMWCYCCYLFVYLSVCFIFSLVFFVSNFYFTSQYHQFPLSHPATAAATTATPTFNNYTKVCCSRICSRLLCSTPRVSASSLWYF
jgi:hypothetical protein